MICNKCKQDGIYIDLSSFRHFKCSVCKAEFVELNSLLEININVEEAYIAGKKAFEEENIPNPYKDSEKEDGPILNKSWEKGYNEERIAYEFEGLLISSEKIKEQLIRVEEERYILLDRGVKYASVYCKIYNWVNSLKYSKLTKVPIFGSIYKDKVIELSERIDNLYKEEVLNNPDK